jgi:hypothetical protein
MLALMWRTIQHFVLFSPHERFELEYGLPEQQRRCSLRLTDLVIFEAFPTFSKCRLPLTDGTIDTETVTT